MWNEMQRWACTKKACSAFLKIAASGDLNENNFKHNHVAVDERSLYDRR